MKEHRNRNIILFQCLSHFSFISSLDCCIIINSHQIHFLSYRCHRSHRHITSQCHNPINLMLLSSFHYRWYIYCTDNLFFDSIDPKPNSLWIHIHCYNIKIHFFCFLDCWQLQNAGSQYHYLFHAYFFSTVSFFATVSLLFRMYMFSVSVSVRLIFLCPKTVATVINKILMSNRIERCLT